MVDEAGQARPLLAFGGSGAARLRVTYRGPGLRCREDERAAAGRASFPKEDVIAEEAKIEMDGEVLEALGGGMFRVQLDNGHTLIAYTAGKMRRYRIRMAPGDRISVQVSAYDLTRGRIVYRHR